MNIPWQQPCEGNVLQASDPRIHERCVFEVSVKPAYWMSQRVLMLRLLKKLLSLFLNIRCFNFLKQMYLLLIYRFTRIHTFHKSKTSYFLK
jgi:hypothetical protein